MEAQELRKKIESITNEIYKKLSIYEATIVKYNNLQLKSINEVNSQRISN